MLSRRPTVAVAALAGAALLASTSCAEQAAAVRVGDRAYSDTDLRDEIEAYADNDDFWGVLAEQSGGGQAPEELRSEVMAGAARDSYKQEFVGELINQRVVFMLADQVLADEDLEVTAADRRDAEGQLGDQLGGFDSFPAAFREDLIEGVATVGVLQQELGDDFNQTLFDKSESVDIEVSSRYGHWDSDQFAVVPPEGPADAPSGSGGSPEAPVPFGG